uniref:Predicted protein n=1 Tax=Hordeum vulgare subsp. vulgare TaxID=112509 RepID=F2DY28_HORVV|nr:predicted protein [Hordeum vulgare subsp. vulgare]
MQDAQFTIGEPSNMAVAFWYPTDGKPWSNSQHYSASCDWLTLDSPHWKLLDTAQPLIVPGMLGPPSPCSFQWWPFACPSLWATQLRRTRVASNLHSLQRSSLDAGNNSIACQHFMTHGIRM